MTKRDFSAAPVFKMVPKGVDLLFEQVALLRGWVDTLTYSIELFKLGLYYREATLVVENNGPGLAVIQFLNEKFHCDFLFKDTTNKADELLQQGTNIGVNTNAQSKGMMISILQSVIAHRPRRLIIRSDVVLRELKGYVQETLPGGSARFKGAGQLNDDTVIGCALPVYAAKTFPVFDLSRYEEEQRALRRVDEAALSEDERHLWGRINHRRDEIETAVREANDGDD
jgi:hypothetical protein